MSLYSAMLNNAQRPSEASSRHEHIVALGLAMSDMFNGQPQAVNHRGRPTRMDRALLSRRRLTGKRASHQSPSPRICG